MLQVHMLRLTGVVTGTGFILMSVSFYKKKFFLNVVKRYVNITNLSCITCPHSRKCHRRCDRSGMVRPWLSDQKAEN